MSWPLRLRPDALVATTPRGVLQDGLFSALLLWLSQFPSAKPLSCRISLSPLQHPSTVGQDWLLTIELFLQACSPGPDIWLKLNSWEGVSSPILHAALAPRAFFVAGSLRGSATTPPCQADALAGKVGIAGFHIGRPAPPHVRGLMSAVGHSLEAVVDVNQKLSCGRDASRATAEGDGTADGITIKSLLRGHHRTHGGDGTRRSVLGTAKLLEAGRVYMVLYFCCWGLWGRSSTCKKARK
ncbi:hypothetical protein EDB80DRAFT_883371 [Ilyonectria destructans]|nr:hypothetical protein EDB80DRAFT_883371 [Ilyonectria destructans]